MTFCVRQLYFDHSGNAARNVGDSSEVQQLRNECEQLQLEQRLSMQQLSDHADVIGGLKNERHSLLATIQMLQQELEDSESMRMRNETTLPRHK